MEKQNLEGPKIGTVVKEKDSNFTMTVRSIKGNSVVCDYFDEQDVPREKEVSIDLLSIV